MNKLHPFEAEQFTATDKDTAEEKATFANWMVSFLAANCPRTELHKARFNVLKNLFGFCPGYGVEWFADEHFSDAGVRADFIDQLQRWPEQFMGHPSRCWSDVERAVQDWYKEFLLEQDQRAELNLTSKTKLAPRRFTMPTLPPASQQQASLF